MSTVYCASPEKLVTLHHVIVVVGMAEILEKDRRGVHSDKKNKSATNEHGISIKLALNDKNKRYGKQF